MKNNDKHYLAKLNYFDAVEKVVCTKVKKDTILIGVKNVKQIPTSLISDLVNTNNYQFHTLDKHALGGRAIDLKLINPITGKYMTGSSSGTAINVFCGINDLGIGTDGGGSVLAPAISLNLFGFISPLIKQEEMEEYSKESTDNIRFSPSIGFISKDFDIIKATIYETMKIEYYENEDITLLKDINDTENYIYNSESINYLNYLEDREKLIKFLINNINKADVMICKEQKIDLDGFGDTVFGHFDNYTKEVQNKANKGYLRVANMVNATAICIPNKDLASAYLLMCESKPEKISKLIKVAESLVVKQDDLVEKYFRNINRYIDAYREG
jgi:hypothetical protein